MSKAAFDRDNILDNDERKVAAEKCLSLLAGHEDSMGSREAEFIENMNDNISRWGVSERQLAWLRDLVAKYAY